MVSPPLPPKSKVQTAPGNRVHGVVVWYGGELIWSPNQPEPLTVQCPQRSRAAPSSQRKRTNLEGNCPSPRLTRPPPSFPLVSAATRAAGTLASTATGELDGTLLCCSPRTSRPVQQ
jgi:hypothetical protein